MKPVILHSIQSGDQTLEILESGDMTMYYEGDPNNGVAPVELVVRLLRAAGWTCEPPSEGATREKDNFYEGPDGERLPYNGLRCTACPELQFQTPSGPVCKNGHGGAPGIPASQAQTYTLPSGDFVAVNIPQNLDKA